MGEQLDAFARGPPEWHANKYRTLPIAREFRRGFALPRPCHVAF